ncbi:uncharacterized protein LOC108147837 [Drosophila elegans]|uniref:uncharacterized protein LOC108147837 n=1 Tax=Drosophila elegans TaxID=30023 RepID=UPI0007E78A2B|nr:uncharacterized protein LOC108147837 [Drosophila elegans]
MKKTCELQELFDGLSQTFAKYKNSRNYEMVQILNRVRCCECGHKMRVNKARQIMPRCPTSTSKDLRTRYLVIFCFLLLFLISIYTVHVARRYNHVRAYGSSACVSTFFYTYTDCDVFY